MIPLQEIWVVITRLVGHKCQTRLHRKQSEIHTHTKYSFAAAPLTENSNFAIKSFSSTGFAWMATEKKKIIITEWQRSCMCVDSTCNELAESSACHGIWLHCGGTEKCCFMEKLNTKMKKKKKRIIGIYCPTTQYIYIDRCSINKAYICIYPAGMLMFPGKHTQYTRK